MDNIYKKLETIRDVWNFNIWDYPYCQSEINFNEDAKTNYFGDMMGYFYDTLDMLKISVDRSGLPEVFSYHISLLQIVYVQQDFIEDMLRLFSTNFNKGDLKKDENYAINRDIRNELVGHPIRRDKTGKLVSSTLFSYEAHQGKIEYLRYHKDNDFRFELVEHNINDVVSRHELFLNAWLDIIIEKLSLVVRKHKSELNKVLKKVSDISRFESLIKLLEQKFQPFLNGTYLYDSKSILKIFNMRQDHQRYNNVYEKFLEDLNLHLVDAITYCDDIFTRRFIVYEPLSIIETPFFIDVVGDNLDEPPSLNLIKPVKNFNYALQKLIDPHRRNYSDFDFFSRLISSQTNDVDVEAELKRMRENIFDDVEYISSCRLIEKILKNDE
ncbi:hypothetical protein [Chryseobacterium indoltheticum]|uniref:Uncharacterized protein n=1 Tax=Chryseobacterium indoltheticum TaxID=254 RepID=A0A381FIP2_9FLAO|nr:hypothetical protein [Chryseobacterium indoltheticum]SUX46353.1 Uncharacterised protein [Chryseobacterium indoltheticum]